MNHKEAIELLPVIQAFAEGRPIQYRIKGNKSAKWDDVDKNYHEFSPHSFQYRIKPESKYRPFKNVEECWQEMQKHQPFGWIINIITEKLRMIDAVDKSEDTDNFLISINGSWWELAQVFKKFTFADGTPFGVEEG